MPASSRIILPIILMAGLLVPLFLGIPPHLRYDPLIGPLGSRYHIALFFVLTLLLYHRGPLAGDLPRVALFCLLLGAITEVVQTFFGRSAAVFDWLLDVQGVGFAACWIWHRRTGRRALPLLGALTLILLMLWPLRTLPARVQETHAARARFPLLEDFERPRALILWERDPRIARTLVAVPGRGSVLQFDSDDDERWPGVKVLRLPWNWSGYRRLHVDCRVVAAPTDSMRITVWLGDRAGRRDIDHAVKSFTVGRSWRTLVVPLDSLITQNGRRPLCLDEINAVAILANRTRPGPLGVQIDSLRLVAD